MKTKNLGRVRAQINLHAVTIFFELTSDALESVLNALTFCFDPTRFNGLTLDTFAKVSDDHGFANGQTGSYRYCGQLEHEGILVGWLLRLGALRKEQQRG